MDRKCKLICTVSEKKISDTIDCNLKKDYQILITFGTNILQGNFSGRLLSSYVYIRNICTKKHQRLVILV